MKQLKPWRRAGDQHVRQLDAIETALNTVTHSLVDQDAANQAIHSEQPVSDPIKIHRHPDSLQLICGGNPIRSDSSSVQIAPLFSGSYSQPDVAIEFGQYFPQLKKRLNLKTYRANGGSAPEVVQPLDPALYFSRFDDPTCKGRYIEDRDGLNLILELPEDVETSWRERFTELTERYPILQHATTVTLLSWCDSYRQHGHGEAAENEDLPNIPEISKSATLYRVRLKKKDTARIFELLCQQDLAVLPSLGLAVDALNAGCACVLWNEQHTQLQALKRVEKSDTSSAEIRRILKDIAHVQLRELVKDRVSTTPNTLVVTRMPELANAVNALYRHTQAPLVENRSTEFRQATAVNDNSYVIAPTLPLMNIRKRLSNLADSVQRKTKKFLNSPIHFCQDSQSPLLRAVAKCVTGIGR
jgi:hypothetical protein